MADPVEAVRRHALWFEAGEEGTRPMLDAIGDARVVLIGEASRGTHEFYRTRADLTMALVRQKGFTLVAAEADWPDAYRAHPSGKPGEVAQSVGCAGLCRGAANPSVGYERLFHDTGRERFVLDLREEPARGALLPARLERAIGVIYRPDTERASHYFRARLPEQFDRVVHIDRTRAVQPLERWAREETDAPETYPTGV